jgi:periplasmic divalent cation tolerance protein
MRSIYRWEGRIQVEAEIPMLLKTTSAAADRLNRLILRYSPYETPCILVLRTDSQNCNQKFVAWAFSEIN